MQVYMKDLISSMSKFSKKYFPIGTIENIADEPLATEMIHNISIMILALLAVQIDLTFIG